MEVEIWSDLTCTHCYITKRKFETALSQFKYRDNIKITWRSFELAPGFKTDPTQFLPAFLQERYGTSMEQVEGMIKQAADSAKEVGLEYNLNKAIPANSFNAHRLSHAAKAQDLQEKFEERVFRAYFIEGKNIDDIPTLLSLAEDIGLHAAEVKNILYSTQFANEVYHDLNQARQSGITSVPQYIFNGNTIVSGGQKSEVYLEILEKEYRKWLSSGERPASEIMDGPSCEIGEDCN